MHTLRLDRLFNTVAERAPDPDPEAASSSHPPSSVAEPDPPPESAINDSDWQDFPPCSTVAMAAVAHELRNAIAPLASAVEIMGSGRANASVLAKTLPMARQQIKQMTRLV